MANDNSDRELNLILKAADQTTQPVRQVIATLKELTTTLTQQAVASKAGQVSMGDFKKSIADVESTAQSLVAQNRTIESFTTLQGKAALAVERVAAAQKKADDYKGGLTGDTRTDREESKLASLQRGIDGAQKRADAATASFERLVAKLGQMGVPINDLAGSSALLVTALHDVDAALKEAGVADRGFVANKQAAVAATKEETAALNAQAAANKLRLRSVQDERGITQTEEVAETKRRLRSSQDARAEEVKAEAASVEKSIAEQARLNKLRIKAAQDARAEAAEADRIAVENRKKSAEALARASATDAQVRTPSGLQGFSNPATAPLRSALEGVASREDATRISDVTSAVDKLDAGLKKGKLSAQVYAETMDKIFAVQRQLAQNAGLLDAFNAQNVAVAKAEQVYQAARQEVIRLSLALEKGKASAQELAAAERTLGSATGGGGVAGELSRELALRDKLAVQLRAQGLDTAKITAEITKQTVAAQRLARIQGETNKSSGKFLGLDAYGVQNLSYQINDVITQLSLGQGVLRTFESQGGQIFQLFRISFAQILAALPAVLAVGGGVAVLASALSRLAELEGSLRRFNALILANVDGVKGQGAAFVLAQKDIEKFGVSFEDAGKGVESFFRAGLDPSRIVEFAKTAQSLVDLYGVKFPEATKQLTTGFLKGYDAVRKLDEEFNFLSLSELKHIKELFESGHAEEARVLAFERFKATQDDAASKSRSTWQVAVRELGVAWREFIDIVANSDGMSNFLTQLREVVQLGTLLVQLASGKLSGSNFGKALSAINSGEALPGESQRKLVDLQNSRTEVQRALTVREREPRAEGAPESAALVALRAKLAEIDTQIKALEGVAGVEGLRQKIETLERRREQIIIRGEKPGEPAAATTSNPGVPDSYTALRDRVADKVGIDREALARVQRVEGVFKDGEFQHSPTGVTGPMQVTRATFEDLKKRYSDIVGGIDDLEANTMAGAYYLKEKLEKSKGKLPEAYAAYNTVPAEYTRANASIRNGVSINNYAGNALQPSGGTGTLADTDKALEAARKALADMPEEARKAQDAVGKTAKTAAESARVSAENTERAAKQAFDFTDKLDKDYANSQDGKLRGRARLEADNRKVEEESKKLYGEAADKAGGPLSPEVASKIERNLEALREKLRSAREDADTADRDKRLQGEQAEADRITAIRKALYGQDATNAVAARQAVKEQFDKERAELDKLERTQGSAAITSIKGVPIADIRKELDALQALTEQKVVLAANIAAVDKLLEDRKKAIDGILQDQLNGSITFAQVMLRMAEVANKSTPAIAEAAARARASLEEKRVGQGGGLTPADIADERKLSDATAGRTDLKGARAGIAGGFKELAEGQSAIRETELAQKSLESKGLSSRTESEAAIKRAYDDFHKRNDQTIKDLEAQVEVIKKLGGSAVEYDKLIAKIKEVRAETEYASQFQKDLVKTIQGSFVSNALQALDTVGASLGKLIAGTGTLKDVFAAAGQAFAAFAAGFLRDIAQMILKTLLLKAIQAIGNAISPGAGDAVSGIAAVATKHGGGPVGSSSDMTKVVDMSVFRNAQRMHVGGTVGLSSNEVPAILEKGERVLSNSEVRSRANMPAGGDKQGTSVRNVLAVGDKEIAAAMSGAHGEKVMISLMKRNAPTIKQFLG